MWTAGYSGLQTIIPAIPVLVEAHNRASAVQRSSRLNTHTQSYKLLIIIYGDYV